MDPMNTTPKRKKRSTLWQHFTLSPGRTKALCNLCNYCNKEFTYTRGSRTHDMSHLPWQHFTLSRGRTKALCNYCKKEFTCTRTHGMSHLLRHICNSYQVLDNKQNNEVTHSKMGPCRHEIARMMIMHEYPLCIVEEPGFVAFVKRFQPQFDMVSVKTAEEGCVTTYHTEKQNLRKVMEAIPGHINLTVDMWSSCHSVGYVVLTGYFMDKDWNIQRKILNVVMEPYPNSNDAFSQLVPTSLIGHQKKSCSQSQLSAIVDNLWDLLSINTHELLGHDLLDGQLLVCKCLACTLKAWPKRQ